MTERKIGIGRLKAMKCKGNRVLGMLLAACLMAAGSPQAAFGATKTISSITIRVGTDTRAGETLNENIGIFADTTSAQSGTYAATASDKYSLKSAEWTTSTQRTMTVGEEPRMKLYLEVDDSDYAFRGTYSSGNINVKGGTYMSARRSASDKLEVTVRLNGIKGVYSPPLDARWREAGYGRAEWTEQESGGGTSGYYDVYLCRGSSVVKKLEGYHGNSYNFYPYMTQAGTYKYKVRTVPFTEIQKQYGQKSDWLDSDEIYLDAAHVSDGTGQVDGNGQTAGGAGQVGWIQSSGTWYYRYPDGSYQKDSWLKLDGKWYLFDRDGRMLTGWQNKDGLGYYMKDDGEMFKGWIKAGDAWYYLNSAADGVEGAMHVGWLKNNGKTYCFGQGGTMLEGWNQIDGNWHYFYPGSGNMAANVVIDTFYVDGNGIWRK